MSIKLVLKSRAGWSFKLKQVINAIDPTLKSLRILLQFIFLLNCVCNLFLNITYDAFFSCICCK